MFLDAKTDNILSVNAGLGPSSKVKNISFFALGIFQTQEGYNKRNNKGVLTRYTLIKVGFHST
jgi:hypothetical protein